MSPLPFALIVIAAFVHVIPHAAIKRADDRNRFVWWMLLGNAVIYSPLLMIEVPRTRVAWEIIVASGAIETVYLLAISRAYSLGNLSVVYPVARGSAPLFLLVASIAFLAERPTAYGIAGIVLIAIGIYAALGGGLPSGPALWWSLLSGLMTATYTTVDKIGIRFVQPLVYIYLVLVVTALIYTPIVLAGRTHVWGRLTQSLPRVLVAAVMMPLAYALVLTAMRLGMPASYAGSLREMSVLVAAAVGIGFFGETITPVRVVGACGIAAGIALIALKG
ncbi:MAG TPA: DMT family transporter [Thermoanaerobaculia bacterium]|jgi:drug/metabolite transporter (DMT)-like permease